MDLNGMLFLFLKVGFQGMWMLDMETWDLQLEGRRSFGWLRRKA
jgi:hypothetical protein